MGLFGLAVYQVSQGNVDGAVASFLGALAILGFVKKAVDIEKKLVKE